jgi:hypothetical protein
MAGLVVSGGEGQQSCGQVVQAGEVVRRDGLFCTIEKNISAWFSQDACTGVWIMMAFGQAAASRVMGAWPR